MKPVVNIYRLARTPYIKALNIQNVLFENLKGIVSSPRGSNDTRLKDNNLHDDSVEKKILSILSADTDPRAAGQSQQPFLPVGNSLILVEHEPVYTVGLRAQLYDRDYVVRLQSKLVERNLKADFVNTNRGGLITFHGPGQLVAYPIIYLGDFPNTIANRSLKAYVRKLEDTIIDTLSRVGVDGAHTIQEHPGVWLAGGERKVAFVGISCKRHVTMHGISINCDCDLSWFDHIVSCGIEDKLITSIRNELSPAGEKSGGSRIANDGSDVSTNRCGEYVFSLDEMGHNDRKHASSQDSGDLGPRFSVQQVANAFCLSFSHHFDCELLERRFPRQNSVSCLL